MASICLGLHELKQNVVLYSKHSVLQTQVSPFRKHSLSGYFTWHLFFTMDELIRLPTNEN